MSHARLFWIQLIYSYAGLFLVWIGPAYASDDSDVSTSWWAFRPLADFSEYNFPESSQNPVDFFINARLDEAGIPANEKADRRTLFRRLKYDLLGLPPTPEELKSFMEDPDPDAWSKWIDRFLASPHYGEKWGRHWLDVIRFGESRGFERNEIINNIWPFRDYVIESIQEDKPFDQFIREHLAGDVIGAGDPDQMIGSAFLVAGPYDDVGNQDPAQAAQIRANTLDEMIRTTTEAFLGLTVGCARCHDHKFDPIPAEDYYALYATFSGVRHGSRVLATPEEMERREQTLQPLIREKSELEKSRNAINEAALDRGLAKLSCYEKEWSRPPVQRTGVEEIFPTVEARWVKLVSQGRDDNPKARSGFRIDEFEIWSADPDPVNVSLSSHGSRAYGPSRNIEDFENAYSADLAIDGEIGAQFISASDYLKIELPEVTRINRVQFSSARGEMATQLYKFTFLSEYRIEVSLDGKNWTTVADSHDRQPVNEAHRNHRIQQAELSDEDREKLSEFNRSIAAVQDQINAVPDLPNVWWGSRNAKDAKGPFHVFVGGSPQRPGDPVTPSSLSALESCGAGYELAAGEEEGKRRLALAEWITDPRNPLTPRVLANRVWHYHFGTGIVSTPNDFGEMGSMPSHPELLDFLARYLQENNWSLKALHRLILNSETWQRSSEWNSVAAKIDGESRLLWRFPPRRLNAEEIRDTFLFVSGVLDNRQGGPGFRLYRYLQDNVATYWPLDEFGPETYRRSVYHQNARAARIDFLTDFDQPDCAFSAPRRLTTTTPLQALTTLNHSFTFDMAHALADRIQREVSVDNQPPGMRCGIEQAFRIAYQRDPSPDEMEACLIAVKAGDWNAFCRALLNSNELIYLD